MAKTFKPYDYQEKVLQDLETAFETSKKGVIVVGPTAVGKTAISSFYASRRVLLRKRVWFCVPLDVLVQQAFETIVSVCAGVGIPPKYIGVIHPNVNAKKSRKGHIDMVRDFSRPIQIAAVQTAANRLEDGTFPKRCYPQDVLFDECHTSFFHQSTRTILDHCDLERVIGLTGTPVRMDDTDSFDDFADDVVFTPTVNDLTYPADGSKPKLCPLTVLKACVVDTDIGQVMGMDEEGENVRMVFDTPEAIAASKRLYAKAVEKTYGIPLTKAPLLGFTVGVKHAENCAKAFTGMVPGYIAEAISWKTAKGRPGDKYPEKKTRCAIIDAFKNGRVHALFSQNVLSVGFDAPNALVGMLLRPTDSQALSDQQIGRIRRTHESKEFGLIIDCVGNVTRHGDGSRTYLAKEILKEAREKDEDAENPFAVSCCNESCDQNLHPMIRLCPKCGTEQPPRKGKPKEQINFDGEKLIEIINPMSLDPGSESDAIRLYRNLLQRCYYENKALPQQAYYRFVKIEAFKEWWSKKPYGPSVWSYGAIFGDPESFEDAKTFYRFLTGKMVGRPGSPTSLKIQVWNAMAAEFSQSVVNRMKAEVAANSPEPVASVSARR